MLVPIERIAKTGYSNSKYLCRCDCGNTTVLRAIYLTQIKQKSCGCIMIKGSEETGVRISFTAYKRNAKKRNLEFSLDKDQFRNLILSRCYYCDGGYTNTTKENYKTKKETRIFLHNGIDRIDNKKGYTLENSVACCGICNLMKREMSVKEWICQMEKILKHMSFLHVAKN